MDFHRRQPPILWWFIPLSIAIHLLLLLVPKTDLLPTPEKDEPIVVEVRPPEQKPRPRELEAPPQPPPEKPREEPAKRLGPLDQRVEKEIAPRGEDAEDLRPTVVTPPPTKPQQPQKTQKPIEKVEPEVKPEPKPEPKHELVQPERPRVERQAEEAPPSAEKPQPQEKPPAEVSKPLPKLESLLQLPETTESRIESELRKKYRSDVEEGDAVWLDMEKDILISFFQRFKNNIYGVWNYPIRAAEQGQEGTCLVKVTVRRDGSVKSVKLMETSGSASLDQEAIRAVWKGGPYGPLPRGYEEEELSIFAFFQYTLGSRPFMFGSN